MKRALILLLAAGCSDGRVGAEADRDLAIQVEAERIYEVTLVVGDSLLLTAAGGDREVAWRSEDPEVVRVRGEGEDVGVVTAVGPGETRVIATSGRLADTVAVTVFAPPAADAECVPGEGLALSIGQSYTFVAASAPVLCISTATPAEYLLVPYNAATVGTASLELTAEGIGGNLIPSRSLGAGAGPLPAAPDAEPAVSSDFDRRLREREARELAGLVRFDEPVAPPRHTIAANTAPAVGATLTINVNSTVSCTNPVHRQARVAAVGTHSVILHDEENPANGFSDSQYREFAQTFDEMVFPTLTSAFGQPTDIDGNGRVMILFTRAVNEMTPPGSNAYVAGFFFARDLFPRVDETGFRGCAASNQGEILYMLAPDPNGTVNGNARSVSFVRARTAAVLGHELQHLINSSRRLRIIRSQTWNEEFWLNEGLSHVAEELLLYATAPVTAGSNIDYNQVRNPSVLPRFNDYQISNASRFSTFLRDPQSASPIWGSDLATRGAAWSFLRYAADRRGGAETDLWRTLVDSDRVGYANLLAAIGASPHAWMHDWAVSLYTDDFVSALPDRFRQLSWNHRSVLPALSSNGGVYPLHVIDLRPQSPTTRVDLGPAGSAAIRFAASAGATVRVENSAPAGSPSPSLRLTLMRTR